MAAESISPAGPIGGTDIRQAQLPPPGLYGAGVGLGVDFQKFWGDSQNYHADGYSAVFGLGVLYVYPEELFGGTVASSVFINGGRTCMGVKPNSKTCSSGMGDTYADLFMWSRFFSSESATSKNPYIPYGLHFMAGLGLSIPNGAYDASKPVNNGRNVYDIAPSFVLTYTTPSILGEAFGDATEFSTRVLLTTTQKTMILVTKTVDL